jgi:hypothetical protein
MVRRRWRLRMIVVMVIPMILLRSLLLNHSRMTSADSQHQARGQK